MKRFALSLIVALGAVAVTGTLLCPDDPARGDDRSRPSAVRPPDHEQARRAMQAGKAVPLRELLVKAEKDFDAQMLEAELDDDDDRWVYELKMLTPSGSILKLKYDATTLTLVKARGHDLARWYRGDPKVLAAVAPMQRQERWMGAQDSRRDLRNGAAPQPSGPFGVLSWFGLDDEDDDAPETHPVTDDRTPE